MKTADEIIKGPNVVLSGGDGYKVVSATACCRDLAPRCVSFCKRFSLLDKLVFAAELIRSIKRIPFR